MVDIKKIFIMMIVFVYGIYYYIKKYDVPKF